MKYNMLKFPNFKQKAVTLSYDDGVVHDKRLFEILKKYGIKCTFNFNSGLLQGEHRRMTKEEAVEFFSEGCEIACHGELHLNLTNVDKASAVHDVIVDRKNLESLFKRRINGMAYSYGTFNDEIVGILANCGIKYARTVISTHKFDLPENWLTLHPTCHHNDPKLFELVDRFLSYDQPFWNKQPQMFYLWGHSYEFNDDNNWERIEEFCEKIANQKDVWYATNIEIYDYVKAFESLQFSVDLKRIFNPTCIPVYLEISGKQIVVEGGEEIVL